MIMGELKLIFLFLAYIKLNTSQKFKFMFILLQNKYNKNSHINTLSEFGNITCIWVWPIDGKVGPVEVVSFRGGEECHKASYFLHFSDTTHRDGTTTPVQVLEGNKGWSDTYYRQVSNISRTLVGNTIVDHSDVIETSPVGAAPTTSSFST